MKKLAMVLVAVMVCSAAQANPKVVQFYGWVTSVSATNQFAKPLDAVTILVNYNTMPNSFSGTITHADIMINQSVINFARSHDGTYVYVDDNPSPDDPSGVGTVQWSILGGNGFSVDVATHTWLGVLPCIDQFDLGRQFEVYFGNVIIHGQIMAQPLARNGN